MNRILFIILTLSLFFCFCSFPANELTVDRGVGFVTGFVYSSNDSTKLDSVYIKMSFIGTNLSGDSASAYSDSNGYFYLCFGLGATIKGDDTTDWVKKCTVTFSKKGFRDTSFTAYEEDKTVEITTDLKIYLHQ
jgi:hypothetical protein